MQHTYRLFKRGSVFYSENTITGKQKSLRTGNKLEAERLLTAQNEATNGSALSLAIGKTYLAATDPESLNRTWQTVMNVMTQRGGDSTRERSLRAVKSKDFDTIRNKKLVETTAADFLAVLAGEKSSTHHYLQLLQSMALDLGWLPSAVLARKCWPTIERESRRAITADEHQKIITAEKNQERRLFYELLWHTGASQADAVALSSANVNWITRQLVYHRLKTATRANLSIGSNLEALLRQLPESGPYFPTLIKWSSTRRAAEFYRRTKMLEINDVSLHSYRYAWAVRAYEAGYPERFAQAALGHESRAIHYGYARNAQVACPSLDDYAQQKAA